jgi:asparagine synthase (glutamine-hydrolysing)
MCGIVGIFDTTIPPSSKEILKMRDIFSYRGPDDAGLWVRRQGQVAFGHRRLSILDPSPAGHQPMHDSELPLTIVYNGEVYNYIEIRERLKKKGYSFVTGTDTEVIIKAYQEWGTDCLQFFNGMFAFAIWDERKESLFLARDRLGIKPLYYYEKSGRLYFASEIKAIIAVLKELPDLSPHLIDVYMSFGYTAGEDTLLKGVKRLLPGCFMVVNSDKREKGKYWELTFSNNQDCGLANYIGQAREILEDAVKIRLRSDVPLGIFLSGGLDSSAVVGLLANKVPERLKTFSVAYDFGPRFDETGYARQIARKFNTEHHEIFITPNDFQSFIPEFVWLMDEPVAESAGISLYFVSRLAKEHVTVVLSGEGSDEVFAGYDFYWYMLLMEKYRSLIGGKQAQAISKIGAFLLPDANKIRKYLLLSASELDKRYRGISTYEAHDKTRLYSNDFAEFLSNNPETEIQFFIERLFRHTGKKDPLSTMLYFDIRTWLIDDLLIKADRMSMAASLELRVPFLDYRLVECLANTPSKYKINGRVTKFLLKEVVKDVLPNNIIHRKKMGFPTPLKKMFETQLSEYAREILLDEVACIREFFNINEVKRLLEEHSKKTQDHHRRIWQLVVLETWMQMYKRGWHNIENNFQMKAML